MLECHVLYFSSFGFCMNEEQTGPSGTQEIKWDELHILHLEDREEDAELVQHAFSGSDVSARFTVTRGRSEFLAALEQGGFDLVLVDSSVPGFDGVKAVRALREKYVDVPLIAVSGTVSDERISNALQAGATNYVLKDNLWQLIAVVRSERERLRVQRHNRAMARLVTVVQELSLARNLESVMAVVRRAARELTGAEGATFVLKDGNFCFYADENAIAPLWKGRRFPLQSCISGWAMLNRQPAVIKDIYADPRIPIDAYRPTFVKSLAMVPIRPEEPLGAIGNYWARQRMPTREEVELLQALANTTAVAMENVQVYSELEKRVKDRTAQLEAANSELESFSFAVSHDLGAPLRSIRAFTDLALKESGDTLNDASKRHLEKVRKSGEHMSNLIQDLLRLARFSKTPLDKTTVNLSDLARDVVNGFSTGEPGRKVDVQIAEKIEVNGDRGLLEAALENLLSNAWKYSSKRDDARIEFGSKTNPSGPNVFFVRDNGAGFDMQQASRLFQPFQRLHRADEFAGTGIGLATVQSIIQRHGGKIWAEAEVDKGATFFFTLAPDKD
jgi:signal transduction histidine kinase